MCGYVCVERKRAKGGGKRRQGEGGKEGGREGGGKGLEYNEICTFKFQVFCFFFFFP